MQTPAGTERGQTVMAIDVKKWLEEKSQELGLDENEKAVAEKIMSNNRFKGDFVPLPDFHSALDKQKTKYETDLSKVVKANQEWLDAYETEYAPALDTIEKLQKAGFDVSNLTVDRSGDVTNRGGQTLTAEQIDAMIAAKVEPLRETAIGWGTFVADKAVEYKDTYGKRFDAEKFRKFGYENREQYPTFAAAYDAFTAEDRKAKETADLDKWRESEREKIRLELMSTATFPEAGGMGEGPSPAFLADAAKEDASREENRAAFARKFADGIKVTI